MEQITVTKYKAKDGSIHDQMGDATNRDKVIDRTNRVRAIIDTLKPELNNAFHYGLLSSSNDASRSTIVLKLAEMVDDHFDKLTKARMESVAKTTVP